MFIDWADKDILVTQDFLLSKQKRGIKTLYVRVYRCLFLDSKIKLN